MSESEATQQANNRFPPTSSATIGEGITVLACTVTADTFDLWDGAGVAPAGFDNCYISIRADGGKVYYSFSATPVTIDETVSTTTTTVAGTTTVTCMDLPDGAGDDYRINAQQHRYINVKAASGTPYLRLWRSSQKRVSRT